jgi:hypothetical protein
MATATRTSTVTLVLSDEEADALRNRLGTGVMPKSNTQVVLNDAIYFALKRLHDPF